MPGHDRQELELVDPADPRLGPYRDLKGAALRRQGGAGAGLFIVEGRLALETALAAACEVVSVLVLKRRRRVLEALPLVPTVPVYVADDDIMRGVTGFEVHRGLLALARRPPAQRAEELLARAPSSPLVVVEGVNDQENLGAIFRNAAGFGAGAVLLDPTCADPLYRRTVRVSLGLVLRVPFARLAPWPSSLGLLEKGGFVPLALTPGARAERIEDVAQALHGRKVALVVGAEGGGLSAGALRACRWVRVPMAPGVDSLNVAAATAVALHRFASL